MIQCHTLALPAHCNLVCDAPADVEETHICMQANNDGSKLPYRPRFTGPAPQVLIAILDCVQNTQHGITVVAVVQIYLCKQQCAQMYNTKKSKYGRTRYAAVSA